jgi:hypothetical protein
MKSKSKTRAQSREDLEKLGFELGRAQKKIKKQEGVITVCGRARNSCTHQWPNCQSAFIAGRQEKKGGLSRPIEP